MSKCWLSIIEGSCSNPHSRTWIFLDFRSFEETIVVNKLFRSGRAIPVALRFMGGRVEPGGGGHGLDLTHKLL